MLKSVTIAIAWIWVTVPLGWGVYQSVQKSLPLFQGNVQPQPTVRTVGEAEQNLPATRSLPSGNRFFRGVRGSSIGVWETVGARETFSRQEVGPRVPTMREQRNVRPLVSWKSPEGPSGFRVGSAVKSGSVRR